MQVGPGQSTVKIVAPDLERDRYRYIAQLFHVANDPSADRITVENSLAKAKMLIGQDVEHYAPDIRNVQNRLDQSQMPQHALQLPRFYRANGQEIAIRIG